MVERRIRVRGNQQAGIAAGFLADRWYRASDGGLVNLDLAQQIQVYLEDNRPILVASYNDGSEVVLREFADEAAAWAELDALATLLHKLYWVRHAKGDATGG